MTPTDAIDIGALEIHASPDVRAWAATTAITGLHFKGASGLLVDFTKRDGPGSWPNVTPPGWGDGNIEFTIWILVQIAGVWHGAGIIQCYRTELGAGDVSPNGGDVGALGQVANNWLYDPRWEAMQHYQPKLGELVGFMVTAGDARGPNDVTLRERSNVVLIPFPPPGESDVTIGQLPPIDGGPVPGPIIVVPTPPQTSGDLAHLEELVKQHEDLNTMRHAELLERFNALKLAGSVQVPYLGASPVTLSAVVKK